MDIWQTASPETPVSSGWIGRWLDVAGDDPLLALNIGDVLPPLAVGTKATAAALSLASAPRARPASDAVIAQLAASDPSDSAAAAQVAASYAAVQRVQTTFAPALAATSAPAGADKKRSALADQLGLVARCIRAGAPSRVYAVSATGFDTHADEKIAQTAQLTSIDQALAQFRSAMAGHQRAGDVVVMAYSEFGRRVRANASQGTDHGTAGPVFVMGDSVRAGFYGDQPSLTDLDNGDLKTTTDFRAVYGEVLHTVLQADPARVLDKPLPSLGFLV